MLSEDQLAHLKELATLIANEHEPARFVILLQEMTDLIEGYRALSRKRAPVIPITAKSATQC